MIACVVVTYNPDNSLIEGINLLSDQVDKILIVDNGSKESGIKLIKEIKKCNEDKIEAVFNGDNLGIAAALNIGAKYAIEHKYQWLLTMDQDSRPAKDMVEKMIKTYEDMPLEKRDEVMSIFPNFFDQSVQNEEEHSNEPYEYVDAEITSGNLVNTKVFDKIGFFDEGLFIDMVDTDFCMRLYRENIKMIKVYDAVLFHSLGEGKRVKTIFGGFNTSNHSALRRYYMTRNRFYTWEKYKDLNSFTLNRDKGLFKKEFVKIILGENDKLNKVKMVFRGYMDYKRGITGKYKER